MKSLSDILLCFMFLLPVNLSAQNLVFNGDFEFHVTCPSAASQVNNAMPWNNFNKGTTDLYDSCASGASTGVGVPVNLSGYQLAASGHGYMGLYAFSHPSDPSGYSEYLAAPITAMTVGTMYEVSMSVSLSNQSGTGCNGLGIWFYDDGPSGAALPITDIATLAVTPQVSYSSYGIITDTVDWVRLVAYFTADSSYDNIVIGKFNPPDGLKIGTTGGAVSFSYYYIDSVVVKEIPRIANLFNDSVLCAGDSFWVNYLVGNVTGYNSDNIFTAELSNAAGNFSGGTTTVGSVKTNTSGTIPCAIPDKIAPGAKYRIRIKASSPVDYSLPNKQDITIYALNAEAHVDTPICTGGLLHLYATASLATGISFSWSGPDDYFSGESDNYISGATATKHNGRYIVVAKGYGCVSTDSIDVAVIKNSIDLGPDELMCTGETRLLKPDIPNGYYLWQDGSIATEYTVTEQGKYWVEVTTGCGVVSDTVEKKYEVCDCQPQVPTAFTPNGDGLNDRAGVLFLDCIVSTYEFIIVNRFGTVVFSSTTPGEKWDGNYNGRMAEVGTYYYLLRFAGPLDKQYKFKGDITLIR